MNISTKTPVSSPSVNAARHAFTLIEMITVIAVVATLMAIATPLLVGSIQASRLTSTGEGMMYRLTRLQQIVATNGTPAEMRFYKYDKEGVSAYRAYQLFAHDKATGESVALENPVYLEGDNLALLEGQLSPLLDSAAHGTTTGAWPRAATEEPFKSMNAQYLRVMFYPDGTTSLNTTLRNAYLTIADETLVQSGQQGLPPNYYTIQIDPVTGRAKSYRP